MTDTQSASQVPPEGDGPCDLAADPSAEGFPYPVHADPERTLKKASALTQVHGHRFTPSHVPGQQETA